MEMKGDKGFTDSITRQNIRKDDPAITALAFLDRLSAEIGMAKLEEPNLAAQLTHIQQALIDTMARISGKAQPLNKDYLTFLDKEIAAQNQTLPPLKEFVLPGANRVEAMLHLCRTTARQAETFLVTAQAQADVLAFINRLSLYFFCLARSNARK